MKKVDHLVARAFKGAMAFVLAVGLCPVAPAMAQEGVAANEEGDTAAAAVDGADVSTDGAVAGATGDVAGSEADGVQSGGVSGDADAAADGAGVGAPAQDAAENDDADSGISAGVVEAAAAADGEADESNDAAVQTDGWQTLGGCEWMIDAEGCLTIRPKDGAEVGELPNTDYTPWHSSDLETKVRSIEIAKGVKASEKCGRLFEGFENLEEADISNLDTSQVRNISWMFYGCKSMTSLDLSGLDLSGVVNYAHMFGNCTALKSLILPNTNSSNATNMSCMFCGCSSLEELDLSSFDLAFMVDASSMFMDCRALYKIAMPKRLAFIDGGDAIQMFYGCEKLGSLDLSGMEAFGSLKTDNMLVDCSSLRLLSLPDFPIKLPRVSGDGLSGRWICSTDGVAYSAGYSSTLSGTYTAQNDSEYRNTWNQYRQCLWKVDDAGELTIRPMPGTSGIIDSSYYGSTPWEAYSDDIKSLVVEEGVSVVGSATGLFQRLNNMAYADVSSLDVSGATDLSYAFQWCSSLEELDLTEWDVSKVTSLNDMFYGCDSLQNLDLSGWDTQNVTDMSHMFADCRSLVSIDVSFFNTTRVERMMYMFSNCEAIRSLDLSSFDTPTKPEMYNMFDNCESLSSLDVSSFVLPDSISDDVYSYTIFQRCDALCKIVVGEGFNLRKVHPNPRAIAGWTGEWVDQSGIAYGVDEIPEKTAGTYYAQIRMSSDMFEVDCNDSVYTGYEITKNVLSSRLLEGIDFDISYANNVYVGIASIDITGKGRVIGSLRYTFNIAKAIPCYKNPEDIEVTYGQTLSDVALPEGFSWQDDPSTSVGDAGEHEFLATFTPGDTSNYEVVRDVPVKVRVARAVDASMFSVDAAGLVYDGSAHEPAVSSAVVPEGSYSVEYRDNVNAGEATAVVSGSGFYSGSCELRFDIAKATPQYDASVPVEAAYGQTLSDVALPKGFSWQDGDISVDWYGSKTQYATYVPEDKNNYNSVSDVPVEVFVLRNEIDVPAVESLTYNGETQVPNLGSLVDGVTVVSNNGGKDAGTYQVTFALENPECDRWSDGTTEDKTVEYSILPRDLNEADVGVEDAVLADGVATPAVNVVSNGQSLVKGVDYDLSFESNDHVGTGVAVVSGTGNYTSEVRLEFRIGIASISDGSPQIYGTDFAYKGSPVTPRVYLAMKNSGVSLREGVDYSVDYSDNDAIGTGKAVLRGIGDYIGTVETTFSIVDRIDLSAEGATTVSVDSIAFYTGSPVEPEVRVRYKQTSLTNGVDYSLRYENNVAEGVATVIVTGKGDYTGEARASFRITNASAYSLSSAGSVYLSGERFLYGGDSFLLAGSKVEPSVSVSLKIGNSRKQLIEGVDYAVSYSSNSSVGTGYVTVKGINGISGSITKSFRIVNSLDVSMLGLGLYDFESDEYLAPAKPKILPSDNFVENVDYGLSYENCDKVGRGKVTVHGMGRYTGTASVEVNIVDKLKRSSLSDCTVDAIPSQVYTGEPIVPNVIVRDGNGRALDSGLEYAVRTSDNVNVGTAKVLAHMGAGFVGYSGYLESSFSIEPADINSVEVAGIEDKEYSGKPVTQDALTLTYNGKSLVEGEDYSVEYSDNTKVGSAALKITGEGNFAGERTINFQVKPKTMQYDFVLKEGVASDPSFWNDTMGSTTYRIDLPQGGIVYLGTTLMGVGSVVCGLSDSNGEVLYTWSPKSGETYGAFALAPGSYYFTLLGSTQYGYGTVGARYDVVKFGDNARFQYEMEPNSPSKEQTIPEVATKIELGGVVAGSFYDPLSSIDLDYYEFTLPEYGPVSMDIVTNKSLMFALVNENGVVIADSITGQSIFEETPNSDETTTMHFGILEPGTYYVCCTARYSSSNGASYFLRVHEDLTAARVDFESTTLEYTGKALEPHPTVTRYGSELKEGSDYYVTYDNNVAPGKARATIVGMGRFGGAGVYVGFNIVRSPGNYIALPGHWATGSGGWWYPYDNGGYPANEWCIIDGSYYRFDGSGYMQTGWLNLGGTWYYLSGSGVMQTGWQKIGGSWYWFDDSGAMASGWRVVDGSYYYFDGSGVMQTGWLSTGSAWYYLSGSGVMATGWQTIGGERYHFDGSGAMASGWTVVDGSYYYFDGSGSMQTGWLNAGGAWYCLSDSGVMQTGWQVIGGAKYHFDDSGAMATGWKWIDGSCYYFDGSGAMQADKWIDGSYVDSDGRWDQSA